MAKTRAPGHAWHPTVRRLALALTAAAGLLIWPAAGQQRAGRTPKPTVPSGEAAPASAAAAATRTRFLEMFGRGYYPGRTGQLVLIPREGDIITRNDPNVPFMHGTPWPYDVAIPLLFAGPAVKPGDYPGPAVQQDVAPTLAAALGVHMPPTASGRALPVLRAGFERPRAVLLVVLDGMRRDYFDRYAAEMPTLTALRRRSAWFGQAQVNAAPSNTAVGHSTIATGADPRVHGITGTNIYDRRRRARYELFDREAPQDLMALTIADVWQQASGGRALVIAQGSMARAATPLGGHGACQVNGTAPVMASYEQETGRWVSNAECFRLPAYLEGRNAKTLWPASGEWMGHKIDSTVNVRYSGLFPPFEADAFTSVIEREPIGADQVPDLLLLNFKGADFVGHKHGPSSNELRATLAEMDRQLARVLKALEAKVGDNYLLAITADHGMPEAAPSPDRHHLAPAIIDLLHRKFDPEGKALVTVYEPENAQLFVDEERLASLHLTLRDLASSLQAQPFVFAAFTEDEVRRASGALKR